MKTFNTALTLEDVIRITRLENIFSDDDEKNEETADFLEAVLSISKKKMTFSEVADLLKAFSESKTTEEIKSILNGATLSKFINGETSTNWIAEYHCDPLIYQALATA